MTGRSQRARSGCRGMFVPREDKAFRDVLDGLANTIMCAEIATDLGDGDKRTISVNAQGDPLHDPLACEQYVDALRPQFWDPSTSNPTQAWPSNGLQERLRLARGFRWALAYPIMTGVLTILPPNRELCAAWDFTSYSTAPPSSRHQGGCHVLMGDGAVKFITDSIEAGDSAVGNVWWAGTGDRNRAPPQP